MSTVSSLVQAKVGPSPGSTGTITNFRLDKTGASVMTAAHGEYYEGSQLGVIANACEQGTGIAPGTALGTTAFFVLYNPAGSGIRLALLKVACGYISGTLGAGTMYHCTLGTATQTAPSGGTALTSVFSDIGNTSSPKGLARVGATVVQPRAFRPFFSLFAELATTATGFQLAAENIMGEIVIEPGCTYQLQAIAAAGTSPLLTVGASWEEVPIYS